MRSWVSAEPGWGGTSGLLSAGVDQTVEGESHSDWPTD